MSTKPSPVDVLTDVPPQAWDVLARGVRRAVEEFASAQVPVALRPFSTFKPDALRDAAHARRAIADALVTDARFRGAVGDAVADDEQRARARQVDALTLRGEVGAERTVALLAVTEQWDALAVLAAVLADERAARGTAAGERTVGRIDASATQVRALRKELAEAKRREADLRRLVRHLTTGRDDAHEQLRQARERERMTAAALDTERADHRERLARARRRAARARRSAAAMQARITEIVGELADLTTRLRAPIKVDEHDVAAVDSRDDSQRAMPRGVRPAAPGRPSRLPSGVDPESATAVAALLQIPGMRVLVDGYNVTKDDRGVPGVSLEAQRRWLVRLMSGVVARYDVRPTVVFDGLADVGAAVPRARGVIVTFATDGTADEMLADLLDGLDDTAPTLVVSSDREVRDVAAAHDVNSVASDQFLAAVVG